MTDVPLQKQRGRPFKKGQTGNPKGRPRGTRHHATVLAERLMENDVGDIVRSVIEAARSGDMVAAKIVLERIVPIRRGRPILIDLPKITSARDIVDAAGIITNAVAVGDLTPEEAAGVSVILEFSRRAIETADLESRILALEAKE